MLATYQRYRVFAVIVIPLALGGGPVRAHAAEPAPGEDVGATPPGMGAPRLHIELTRPADLKLFEVTGKMSAMNFRTGPMTITASRPVCVAPCGQVVDGRQGQPFFFDGDGVIKSREFSLAGRSGDVVARVRPGRAALRVGGVAVMILGGIGLGTSGLLFLTADRGSQRYDDMGQALPRPEPNYLPATALLISGALVAIGGLVMVLRSRTKIQWSQRTAAARRRLGFG